MTTERGDAPPRTLRERIARIIEGTNHLPEEPPHKYSYAVADEILEALSEALRCICSMSGLDPECPIHGERRR